MNGGNQKVWWAPATPPPDDPSRRGSNLVMLIELLDLRVRVVYDTCRIEILLQEGEELLAQPEIEFLRPHDIPDAARIRRLGINLQHTVVVFGTHQRRGYRLARQRRFHLLLVRGEKHVLLEPPVSDSVLALLVLVAVPVHELLDVVGERRGASFAGGHDIKRGIDQAPVLLLGGEQRHMTGHVRGLSFVVEGLEIVDLLRRENVTAGAKRVDIGSLVVRENLFGHQARLPQLLPLGARPARRGSSLRRRRPRRYRTTPRTNAAKSDSSSPCRAVCRPCHRVRPS